ncbi:EAL domain-containing protein [Motiliproteus sp. SC1-56]|uniref:EAL domain-containing protein n=1 Tax=Motiliproteus sp. SC1-56 TaxID=2799565 RepID=UPI001A8C6854|nr:EAL domain-containing protein [Motiliproteus sp. SC1-56]
MRQMSWTPMLAGITILMLLSFLFFQAQQVDEINEEHSAVLDTLYQAQRLDDQLRQGVLQIYYERHHNFDRVLQDQRRLSGIIRELGSSSYSSFREASTGVEYYVNRLANLQQEREDLLARYMRSVVLLKNAVSGLSQSQLTAKLEAGSELRQTVAAYRDSLLRYATNPDPGLGEEAQELIEALEYALYDLAESPLHDEFEYGLQHGEVLLRERQQLGGLINQIFEVPIPSHLAQVTDAYLQYHEQQERFSRYYRIGLFAAGALLLVLLVVTLLRLRHTAVHLFGEKEMAQITLSSIGDAVITTDHHGNISFMNPAAEKLTGHTASGAKGRPLAEVLTLVSEINHRPVDDPAKQAMANESVVELAQHIYMERPEGGLSHVTLTASPIGYAGERILGAVLVVQDEGEARVLAEQLSYETSHDALTGLLNRLTFAQRIHNTLNEYEGKHSPILWHIDLDHFAVINDICGSKGGDGLLRVISGVLKEVIGDHDVLSRVGGDEFAILRAKAGPADALNLACKVREAINEIDFDWEDNRFDITATIGVVFINDSYRDLSDVFMAAKAAVDTARENGRNNIHIHTKDHYEKSRKHELSLWVPKIKKALDEKRYHLFLQSISPVTEQGCQAPHHAEVLIRMENEEGKLLPPIFIPAAEEYDLMQQVDRWVIQEVCANIALAQEQGLPDKDLCYSVNLSGTTLSDTFFLDYLRGLFSEFKTPTEQICFEITETAAIQNLESAVVFIEAVRKLGCKFALDDFGSGMSSFAYLKSLPVDYLKIDGAFVKRLAQDPVQYSIVEAVNKVGHTLGMHTIAEFVEDDDIIRGLSKIGVNYAQGYGIDRPRPWREYFDAATGERQVAG